MPRRTTRDVARRLRASLTPHRDPVPDLGGLAQTWDTLGTCDPLWSILTKPGTDGGRWDVEEFFESGREQVDWSIKLVEEDVGWALDSARALDFGCGVGRLTQALCRRFEEVDGVDIAPSMIRAAERFNRFGDHCRYHVNIREDLRMFPDASFDFVYSTYVLQHMHPVFARAYVVEFMRLLTPRGVALFQIPTGARRSGTNEPMPDAWFASEQELVTAPPSPVTAGGSATVRLRVTNRSAGVWPSRGERAVRVGARWRGGDPAESFVEARGSLPTDLEPDGQATVDIDLVAPDRPGHFVLECGLLQENVAWFADKGGPMAMIEIDVVGSAGGPPEDASPHGGAVPAMEMHTTSVEEVTAWVAEGGGRILRAIDAPPDENYEGYLFAAVRDD